MDINIKSQNCAQFLGKWTQAEIARARARMEKLAALGLAGDEADRLVEALIERDRGYDDRRICVECRNFAAKRGAFACSKGQVAMPIVLQRCDYFKLRGGK